jgi:hypothetical protein
MKKVAFPSPGSEGYLPLPACDAMPQQRRFRYGLHARETAPNYGGLEKGFLPQAPAPKLTYPARAAKHVAASGSLSFVFW